MKSKFFFLLATLLVLAILVPSVITLLDANKKTELVVDFNEEDNNKKEKKENTEKEFCSSFESYVHFEPNFFTTKTYLFSLEKPDLCSFSIFLPPPEQTC